MALKRGTTAWWVVANERRAGEGWHWDNFFGTKCRDPYTWGGPGWINSAQSFARIQKMRRGDFVVAYQGGEGVVGITRLKTPGYQEVDSENFDSFKLDPKGPIQFENPIPLAAIKQLPNARDTFEFVRSGRGTVHRIESGGFEQVLALAIAFNPALASQLLRLHPAA